MNITLSIDERIAEQARETAAAMGIHWSQAVRGCLEPLAGKHQLDAELKAHEASALAAPGPLKGWKFDRDEANHRA